MKNRQKAVLAAAMGGVALSLLFAPDRIMAEESPCDGSLEYLRDKYRSEEATRVAFDMIYLGLHKLPKGYSYKGSAENPWKAAGSGKGIKKMMVDMFKTWCTYPPGIQGDSDNGLDPILYFAWTFYQNPAGQDFVQGRNPLKPHKKLKTGQKFLSLWNEEYLRYMDSKASAKPVGQWVEDPRIEINDYEKTKTEEYHSWNEFFARNLKSDEDGNYPSRPVTMPDRKYVVVSPTDCIMNPLLQVMDSENSYKRKYIENPLQLDTVLDVKHIPISVNDMLGTASDEIKKKFIGGSGLTCVLMPNTYHHFHSPVDGTVIHAEIVKTGAPGTPGTFGYPDYPNWVPLDGNVGRPGTDFSQFQAFQRGVIVIKMEYKNLAGEIPEVLTGYVASIPVGLDSVGSVVLNTCDSKHTDHVNCFDVGSQVQKGKTKFGNFFYGGSLNILLFSKGMSSPAVQTRMGNQIGIINIGTSPKSPWSQD
ncbi:MAG: phosphatidylserine decarboxylase [Gammaproteobacteria bacterium]|nr:phosphatidylserine decarboxylase [Gammaproteobacteria bacterium]